MFSGRSYGGRPARSCPSSTMRPAVGVSKPASMRSSVVLPQPDEPSSAKISPLAMSIETWLTATAPPPKSFTTSTICRNAGAATAILQTGLEAGVQARHRAPDVVGQGIGRLHLLHLGIG